MRVMTGGQGDRRADEQKAANHCGGTVGSRSTRTPGTELQNNKSGAKSEQTQRESEQNKSDLLQLTSSAWLVKNGCRRQTCQQLTKAMKAVWQCPQR